MTIWLHAPAAAAQRRAATTFAGCVQLESAFRHSQGLAMPVDLTADADLVVMDGGTAYVLNGTRERELRSRVGRRVEVTGAIETARRDDAAPAVVPGVTPEGSAAHEVADAATGVRVPATAPAAPEPERLNVQSFRSVDGACAALPPPPARMATGAGAANVVPVTAEQAVSGPQRTTIRGCLVVDPDVPERFVINGVRIDGVQSTLTPHKGAVLEVTGTLVEETAVATSGREAAPAVKDGVRLPPPAPIAAHPSASRRLVVSSVRAVGGTCP